MLFKGAETDGGQVAGLRETLASPDGHASSPGATKLSLGFVPASSRADSLQIPNGNALPDLDDDTRRFLLSTYRARVDSVYKIWHWPAVIATISARSHNGAQSTSAQALESALYFMGTCSLTEDECNDAFVHSKDQLLIQYRTSTETLLTGSELITRPNLVSFQALLIYLVSSR